MTEDQLVALRVWLADDEGERSKPYVDTVGKITIGIGRNLTDNGLSPDEIEFLFRNDANRVEAELTHAFAWFPTLDTIRQRVLLDMNFNLGISRLRLFIEMLAAVEIGDYARAADEMLQSHWAKQVGRRAIRLAAMMRDGQHVAASAAPTAP